MNWNSIVRAIAAFVTYISLVVAHLSGLSPVSFALVSAVLIGVGLWAHSWNIRTPVSRPESSTPACRALVPSLAESMQQLHSLQLEINELQTQFADEADNYGRQNSSRGFVG